MGLNRMPERRSVSERVGAMSERRSVTEVTERVGAMSERDGVMTDVASTYVLCPRVKTRINSNSGASELRR